MAGNAMGALTLRVGDADYRLWLGFSVLADVQAEMPEQFDAMMAGGATPLKLVHRIIAGSLERYHPEQAADRFFVDELIDENRDAMQQLMGAAAPSAGGKAPAARAKPRK